VVLVAMVGMRELRKKAGLSIEMVAVRLNKTSSTIHNWESGRHKPNLEPNEMLLLCELYNCTLKELAEAVKETGKLVTK